MHVAQMEVDGAQQGGHDLVTRRKFEGEVGAKMEIRGMNGGLGEISPFYNSVTNIFHSLSETQFMLELFQIQQTQPTGRKCT